MKVSNCSAAKKVKTQLRFRFGLDGFFVLSPIVIIVMQLTRHI